MDDEILYDEPLKYQPLSRREIVIIDKAQFERLKKQSKLWDSLKHQLGLYREAYNDIYDEDHPYIPKILDLMATLEEYID